MSPTIYEPSPARRKSDVDAATERTRATWTAGDYGRIAVGFASGAAEFIARLQLSQGERVLDVACGTGNLTLPAARAGALATGIDIAPNLVAEAITNAAAEDLAVRFEVGDAEALPGATASFDTVVSMFGVMFAPHPERAAAELLRVTTRGGRIGLANWTPSSFVGQMLRTLGAYVQPAAGMASPLEWGVAEVVRERLAGVASIGSVRRRIAFTYPFAPAGTVRLFRDCYGPITRTFAALPAERQALLEEDLVRLWEGNNLATDGTTRVESEYLEVIAVR